MKHAFWAAGILSASLFVGRVGHTTEGWVQIPGAATQIAVGANDIPFVLDVNGWVQYLKPPTVSCGQGLCVYGLREWQWFNTKASQIACDQYGYLWSTDSAGSLASMLPATIPFYTTMTPMGVAAIVSSLAPGKIKWPYSDWKVPFGVARGPGGDVPWSVPVTTTYVTGAGSPSLLSIDLTWHPQLTGSNGNFAWAIFYTNTGWQQIDTGELQVTQFTIDGSADQVPWFFVYSTGGYRTPYAMLSPGNYKNAGVPTMFGLKFDVDWMTDHYVAASRGAISTVFRWTGNAYGSGGGWTRLTNSESIPSGGKIARIAYASALPGTKIGTIGPSHLYMIDTYNNIYQWGTLESTPK